MHGEISFSGSKGYVIAQIERQWSKTPEISAYQAAVGMVRAMPGSHVSIRMSVGYGKAEFGSVELQVSSWTPKRPD